MVLVALRIPGNRGYTVWALFVHTAMTCVPVSCYAPFTTSGSCCPTALSLSLFTFPFPLYLALLISFVRELSAKLHGEGKVHVASPFYTFTDTQEDPAACRYLTIVESLENFEQFSFHVRSEATACVAKSSERQTEKQRQRLTGLAYGWLGKPQVL